MTKFGQQLRHIEDRIKNLEQLARLATAQGPASHARSDAKVAGDPKRRGLLDNVRSGRGLKIILTVAIPLGLAVLQILLAIESEALAGLGVVGTFFSEPWRVIWDMPHTVPLDAITSSGGDSTREENPLFIIALDVSDSMKRPLDAVEERRYREAIVEGIDDPDQRDKMARCLDMLRDGGDFGVARSEACRYIQDLRDGACLSIWTFGNAAERVWPVPRLDDRTFACVNQDGWYGRNPALENLEKLEARTERTHFNELFKKTIETYFDEPSTQYRCVHLVILSDFRHDMRGAIRVPEVGSPGFVSHTDDVRVNREEISRLIQKIGRKKGMLHLSVVEGAERSSYAILSVDDLVHRGKPGSWQEMWPVTLRTPRLDFLRHYKGATRTATFRYGPTYEHIEPLGIGLDPATTLGRNVRFRIAVAQRLTNSRACNFFAEVKHKKGHGTQSTKTGVGVDEMDADDIGVISAEQEFVGKLPIQDGDQLIIKPAHWLDPTDAGACVVVLAAGDQGVHDAAGVTNLATYTYLIPIEFRRNLGWSSAICMLGLIVSALMGLVCVAVAPLLRKVHFQMPRISKAGDAVGVVSR